MAWFSFMRRLLDRREPKAAPESPDYACGDLPHLPPGLTFNLPEGAVGARVYGTGFLPEGVFVPRESP